MEPNLFVHSQSAEVLRLFPLLLIIFFVLVGLIVTVIKVLVFCKIFSKAGYCWALGLLMLVPIANIIMVFVLAFADWPILKELRVLKQQQEKLGT